MYQRNDTGQIVIACVAAVFLFFANMYVSYANIISMMEDTAGYSNYEYSSDNEGRSSITSDIISNKVTTSEPTKTEQAKPATTTTSSSTTGKQETPPRDQRSINADKALNNFKNYHRALTNHNFSQAYRMLTNNYQTTMVGDYDRWVNGYSTTKESVVDGAKIRVLEDELIVISYTMHAVDYEGNGTVRRNFKGEVTMRKVGSDWLIDDITGEQI